MKRLLVIIILLVTTSAYGATFLWDANSEPDLAGYKLYHDGVEMVDVNHTENSVIVENAPNGCYSLTAYDTDGFESYPTRAVVLAVQCYGSVKYDFSTYGLVLYKGEHVNQDAGDSDTNWVVTKYYYNSSGMIIQERTRTTSWTDRAVGW